MNERRPGDRTALTGKAAGMGENHRDQIVDEATRAVLSKPGVTADEQTVRELTALAVDDLIHQPVQTFTPLLAENEVLTQLHRRGEIRTRARSVLAAP